MSIYLKINPAMNLYSTLIKQHRFPKTYAHNYIARHTACASAIPDSNNSSCATRSDLADVSFLTSLFNLFRSDLYSLSLARSIAFKFGCKLLASRSIFLIWHSSNIHQKQIQEDFIIQYDEQGTLPQHQPRPIQLVVLKSVCSSALQIVTAQ